MQRTTLKKISQVQKYMPVVTATWKANAGGLLAPRGLRSAWTTIVRLHKKREIQRKEERKAAMQTKLLYTKMSVYNSTNKNICKQ
jgi:hypothetical protein